MIKTIYLRDTSCFDKAEKVKDLKNVNYIFGPNGSGKTTISTLLNNLSNAAAADNPKEQKDTRVDWEKESLPIKVYNRDYLKKTFTEPQGEPGVFLLGSEQADDYNEINTLLKEIKQINDDLKVLNDESQQMKDELDAEENYFKEEMWKKRASLPLELQKLEGMGKRDSCYEKVLKTAKDYTDRSSEFKNVTSAEAFKTILAQLKQLDDSQQELASIASPPTLPNLTEFPDLLSAAIVGSKETNLSELINRLSNLDWVRSGKNYFESDLNSDKRCPFCQQSTPEMFGLELEMLFDKDYEEKLANIQAAAVSLEEYMTQLASYKTDNLNVLEQFASEASGVFEALEGALREVIDCFKKKAATPSVAIDAEPLSRLDGQSKALLAVHTEANKDINAYNARLRNRKKAKGEVDEKAWREFTRGLMGDLVDAHNRFLNDANRDKKKQTTDTEKSKKETALEEKKEDLDELHKKSGSIEAVIKEINSLLTGSSFYRFKLAKSKSLENGYVIMRPAREGSQEQVADVSTLSEGERTFITFLYFYYSLQEAKAKQSESIVVIDDPISSLDSEVMFIVSRLIRDLAKEACDSKSENRYIKQVIILTHNSRFHNQVALDFIGQSKKKFREKNLSFYRVQKSTDFSRIKACGSENPIRSAYQELWDEVAAAKAIFDPAKPRAAGSRGENMPWLPNVLRRILESYFFTLGDKKLQDIPKGLGEAEKKIAISLIDFLHSGSHAVLMGDESYSENEYSTEQWLSVFKSLFESSGHMAHYEMMLASARSCET